MSTANGCCKPHRYSSTAQALSGRVPLPSFACIRYCICHNGQPSLFPITPSAHPRHRLFLASHLLAAVNYTRSSTAVPKNILALGTSSFFFCREAALCTVSCLRLPQPLCTSPLPLLTQHLLRDCLLALNYNRAGSRLATTFYLSHRLTRSQRHARDCIVLEPATRG